MLLQRTIIQHQVDMKTLVDLIRWEAIQYQIIRDLVLLRLVEKSKFHLMLWKLLNSLVQVIMSIQEIFLQAFNQFQHSRQLPREHLVMKVDLNGLLVLEHRVLAPICLHVILDTLEFHQGLIQQNHLCLKKDLFQK